MEAVLVLCSTSCRCIWEAKALVKVCNIFKIPLIYKALNKTLTKSFVYI